MMKKVLVITLIITLILSMSSLISNAEEITVDENLSRMAGVT